MQHPDSAPDPQHLHLPPAGKLSYTPEWLAAPAAVKLQRKLLEVLDWRQLPVRLFGRWIPQPRLTDFCGDPGTCYTYAGLRLEGSGWPEALGRLRERIATDAGEVFNTVLCNLYRDGRDYMGWHSDAERELGPSPVIASLSLGAARRFLLRPRPGTDGRPQELILESGSLLVMAGDLQHHWQHQLPRALRVSEARINLTFRRVGV